jgi:hypothetical protein
MVDGSRASTTTEKLSQLCPVMSIKCNNSASDFNLVEGAPVRNPPSTLATPFAADLQHVTTGPKSGQANRSLVMNGACYMICALEVRGSGAAHGLRAGRDAGQVSERVVLHGDRGLVKDIETWGGTIRGKGALWPAGPRASSAVDSSLRQQFRLLRVRHYATK